MKTPICDFVKKYADASPLRAHMPGHKGCGGNFGKKFDITEIEGADLLYHADGIIAESENNAQAIFGSAKTLYSAEGSSLSIRAMLFLLKKYAISQNKKPKIIAGRNAHKVFTSSAALLGIEVEYIFPSGGSYIQCDISPISLDEKLAKIPEKPTAVYITSPDYLGNISDIKAISLVCHKHGVLLFVDNAHGAYLKFLENDIHPISLGADVCCDSAHKTLFSLTGGGYLHISENAPVFFTENACSAMSIFASTSPSYLILQSLDEQNRYLASDFPNDLNKTIRKIAELKDVLKDHGYTLIGSEPLKIALSCREYGYSGYEISGILQKENIYTEFCDPDFLVMMLTTNNSDSDYEKIASILCSIPQKSPIKQECPMPPIPTRALSPDIALFAESEMIDVSDSVWRVLADISVACPPAIPIVSLGEIISPEAVCAFKYYGIKKVTVIK